MDLEFFCPHCGRQMKINVPKTLPNDIICDLCGANIVEQAKEALNQEKARASSQAAPTPELSLFPTTQQPPAFPLSRIAQRPVSSPIPFNNTITPSAFGKIELLIPQLGQKIPILENDSIYHFGRNYLLPLIDPMQYDTEFLNSISRVKKDEQTGQINHEHFMITRDEQGNFFIEDSHSKWGTWLNRKQIKGKGKVELHKGDKIELMLSKPGVKTAFPLLILFNV